MDRSIYATAASQEGPWTLTVNLGAQTPGRATARTVPMAGLLLQRTLQKGWGIGAQVYGNGDQESGSKGERSWGLGLTKDLPRRWQFQAMAGRGLGDARERNLFLGFSATLGGGA